MNTATSRLTATLAPVQARWQALGARERRLLVWAGRLLAVALVWFVAVQPAWRTARAAPVRLDQLDSQLQQMQRLAGEARQLRGAPAVGAVQAQAAVKAACDALGGAARLQLGGDRATITFTNIGGPQLREWFDEVRTAARARPLEASLTRGTQGYSGTVVLALPGGGS